MNTPVRILHFSDIHIGCAWHAIPPTRWLGKRSVGALNLLAGRRRRFADSTTKLAGLTRLRDEQRIDLVLFTGDYTALGLEPEFAAARRAVNPLIDSSAGYVGIPGNHDIYSFDVVRERSFNRHFGETLRTDLPEFAVDNGWPLVRLLDERVAVVALDSARPNPQPWRSSGRLPHRQLDAFAQLLDEERIRDRFVFVLNHYPPRLADGSRDRPLHRLVNDNAFLGVCRKIRRGAILSGHVHHRYHLRMPETAAPLFCSGSATMAGREGLWIFEVESSAVRAIPGHWNGARYLLDPAESVTL
jgi:3',5'-cyclic AMP phosphodiesterase CpdA